MASEINLFFLYGICSLFALIFRCYLILQFWEIKANKFILQLIPINVFLFPMQINAIFFFHWIKLILNTYSIFDLMFRHSQQR